MTEKPTQASKKAQARVFKRSPCPITSLLDIIGDKWSLVILRDMFIGKSRYGEFTQSPEKIPTNLLAERLKRLEGAGLIYKEVYQTQPVRNAYYLTDKGRDTRPILQAMVRWGNKHIENTVVPPASFMEHPEPDSEDNAPPINKA